MSNSTLRGGRTRKFKAEINVVPYIDVMLVLLVIFMVAAPLTNPSVINLPTAGKSALPPTAYIEIGLQPNARSTIAMRGPAAGKTDTAADRDALTQKLQALHDENPELPVMISADKDIKYDEVIQTITAAKKLGVTRVGLATK
ncbi:MAG TPA: ExbD/TolR family protein [Herbaspirillum sp.]|jgi:biopolymer transport protein TolR|nr:ExbD/TolR family protein [Herbaspirillum sp.]